MPIPHLHKALFVRRNLKLLIIISFILLVILLQVEGQDRFNALEAKLETADSVLIVGHENTNEIPFVDKSTGKKIVSPKLIRRGKVNYTIIHQRQRLSEQAKNGLTNILTRPFQDSIIEDGKCFIPHHAILIFKNQKISFIDICFGCSHLVTSEDIKVTDDDFDRRKWSELQSYFKQNRITYMLDEAKE